MLPDEGLIDKIYEAGVVPDLWPDVLLRLSDMIEGVGAVLLAWQGQTAKGRATPGIYSDLLRVFERDGWAARNSRATRLAALRHAGFIVDHDIFTDEELAKDPFYTEFLRPHGVGWGTGTMMTMPSGETLIFNVERAYERGPVERSYVEQLDGLRPHLARAALVSARIGLERAKAMANALEVIGLPGAVIGIGGRVLASNPLLERLHGQVIARAFGKIAFANPSANMLLTKALSQLRSREGIRSIAVPGVNEHPALVAHVVPIRGSAYDVFTGAEGLLILTPVGGVQAPSASLLDALFDLSPAEARVACSLTEGENVIEIATRTGVSPETVRSQVKSILHKVGLSRQAELVGLLSSIGARSPRVPSNGT